MLEFGQLELLVAGYAFRVWVVVPNEIVSELGEARGRGVAPPVFDCAVLSLWGAGLGCCGWGVSHGGAVEELENRDV